MRKLFTRSAVLISLFASTLSFADSGRTVFVPSAVEHPDDTVTLPLFRGTSHGDTVYYVIIDTSDGNLSQRLGVNTSQKLANASNTQAVQKVTTINGAIDFPATVDFAPDHLLSVPSSFPPQVFQPGAVGESGYSPLIRLANGTVLNAPQIARDQNHDGKIDLFTEAADKVASIDTVNMKVVYRETNGFQGGKAVKYTSFDASDALAATLEDSTFAEALNAAPAAGDDSTHSARASLAGFVNGQTGAANPQRQGLNSAVLGDGDPLNILRWNPKQGHYSPLWDVNLAAWSSSAVAASANLRQTDWGTVQGLADHGLISAPDGSRFRATGFIVNCPIISQSN